MTLVEVLRRTETWFRERGLPTPRLDAELLLGHVLGLPRMQLYLQYDRPLDEAELSRLRPLVQQRGQRQPLAYLTGTVGFHNIELSVRPGVLVPRPDTETLVEAALQLMRPPDGEPIYVADVGAGSGAVGLAIAAAREDTRVFQTDVAPIPLEVTRENVRRLGLEKRVAVLQGTLLTPIPLDRTIDWVVSNPPYIPSAVIETLQPEVAHHEPRVALDGGRDGLTIVRALIRSARERARKGLLMEIGHDQSNEVARLFEQGGFVDISRHKDLGGHERVISGRIPGV